MANVHRLVDELLRAKHGVTLAEFLRDHRQHGGYEYIARELYRHTDGAIAVSYQTVKRWLQQLPNGGAA